MGRRRDRRQVIATRDKFATTDLSSAPQARGINQLSSQGYRLVVDRPERLSLRVLMAVLDLVGCEMGG